jgi:hypothetical protein
MMNNITNIERVQQQTMRPPYKGQPQRQNQTWRPRPPNEQRVPNTLEPTNVIDQEETPWCFPCGDAHWEHECPRNNDGGPDYMNFLDSIFTISSQEYFNVTQEQLEEGKKEAARRARMEILSQMDEESRERLRKKELQVYARQKNVPQAPPSDPRFPRPRPPPPSKDSFLPQPTSPRNDEIDLNIDIVSILEKVNVCTSHMEMIKIPSMRNKVERFLRVQGELGDPPILIQANHCRRYCEENPPFFISLELNNKWLHNCMMDSGASANVMTLRVMRQLGLEITRPYGNVCGIDSKAISAYGLIENLEVRLARYPEIVFVMDIVVDIPDIWGMLLSRKWVATLGGTLHMDFLMLLYHGK